MIDEAWPPLDAELPGVARAPDARLDHHDPQVRKVLGERDCQTETDGGFPLPIKGTAHGENPGLRYLRVGVDAPEQLATVRKRQADRLTSGDLATALRSGQRACVRCSDTDRG